MAILSRDLNRQRRKLWWVTLLASVVTLGLAISWRIGVSATHLAASPSNTQQVSNRYNFAFNPHSVSHQDYASTLTSDGSSVAWARILIQAAHSTGVSVLSLTNVQTSPQKDRLGNDEIQVTVRGPYPNVKLLLKDVIDRSPTSTVLRLSIQRLDGAAPLVEASVSLALWSRPLVEMPAAVSVPPRR